MPAFGLGLITNEGPLPLKLFPALSKARKEVVTVPMKPLSGAGAVSWFGAKTIEVFSPLFPFADKCPLPRTTLSNSSRSKVGNAKPAVARLGKG
jgi:hypothetical protein